MEQNFEANDEVLNFHNIFVIPKTGILWQNMKSSDS